MRVFHTDLTTEGTEAACEAGEVAQEASWSIVCASLGEENLSLNARIYEKTMLLAHILYHSVYPHSLPCEFAVLTK